MFERKLVAPSLCGQQEADPSCVCLSDKSRIDHRVSQRLRDRADGPPVERTNR
jgi:hypothetical protein